MAGEPVAPGAVRLVLAPFRGITTRIYRNALARHIGGFDEMLAPFVSGTGITRISPSKLADLVPPDGNQCLTIPQILSGSAKEIILFARVLEEYGFDHLNWNLGCPFQRIAGKGRGCGMLREPDRLRAILDEVFRDLPLGLSVKTRLGYHNPEEIFRAIKVFNDYPLRELTIHPRIGTQVYKGEVNLQGFAACLSHSRIPLTYNGDLYHSSKYRELQRRFPQIRSWMPGRGALINPFLALEIRGRSLSETEKRARLQDFLQELFDGVTAVIPHQGKRLGYLKAIWYYLSGMFQEGGPLFAHLKGACSPGQYLSIVAEAIQQPLASEEQMEGYFRHTLKHAGRDDGETS
jgi:tRNA-dihydrouridine synthase